MKVAVSLTQPVATAAPVAGRKRLLRSRDVCERLAISRTTLWRLLRTDPSFPRPIRLLSKGDRYDADEINAWLASRVARHG
jgi:prophage regulatory protein